MSEASPFGLRQLIPPSLLARRWIAVLVCYLDDSGTDPQNRIITLAGFAASDEQWAAFEREVEPTFAEYNVGILHTKELHDTDGDFAGWSVLRKQAFIAKVGRALAHHVPLGMSHSVLKSTYEAHAKERLPRRTSSDYAFCFNRILDWCLRDVRVGKVANTEGVAFVLECGNENNPDAEKTFWEVRERYGLQDVLRSISFVGKTSCRAIQTADMLAFYTRRHGQAMEAAPLDERPDVPPGVMLNIILEGVPIYSYVATDFGDAT